MNTISAVTSELRRLGRGAAFAAAALLLAGCGQTWQDQPGYVTIGGDVAGLTGTVVLEDNAKDDLSLASNGTFTFPLQIANGAAYAVTVKTQPRDQVCSVAGATGTAQANVHSVHVTCASYVTVGGTISGLTGTVVLQINGGDTLATAANGSFTFPTSIAPGSAFAISVLTQPAGQNCIVTQGSGTTTTTAYTSAGVKCSSSTFVLRPLPAIYATGKAINYGPYRSTGGPPAGETICPQVTGAPTCLSDTELLQDLALLNSAGFNLIRLFGADAVGERIVSLAATHYPDMRFHLGAYLEGATSSCVDTLNTTNIATLIRIANQYPNIATVSVGNETSLAHNLPVACLASYIQTVRAQVAQPVTADDDISFYSGNSSIGEKPDTILPLIDFVSLHVYAFSGTAYWDWQQTAIGTLYPDRATAMMNASMVRTQALYDAAAGYLYRAASGSSTTIGASLPIVVGETGWKAALNNHWKPGNPIEVFSATAAAPVPVSPVNAKWFYDLSSVRTAWTGTPAWTPTTIFYFEAFDEPWKQTGRYDNNDDGWGLWDLSRTPRYALCGTYAGAPACSAPDAYVGAGYFH